MKNKAINWRSKYDSLLALLAEWRNESGSRYNDMRMQSPAVEKLHRLAERNKRYEWKKIGQAHHLFPIHDSANSPSVAFVLKIKGNVYEYTIMAKGFKTIVDRTTTEAKAKKEVEKHFILLQTEEE